MVMTLLTVRSNASSFLLSATSFIDCSAVLVINFVNDCFSPFIFTNSLLQDIDLSDGQKTYLYFQIISCFF